MIETGLATLLSNDATVNGFIAGRIYPVILPESPSLPAVTLRTISSVPAYELTRASSMVTTRIEFTAWATDYATCKTIIEAIRNVLDFYSGTLADGTTVQNAIRAAMMTDAFNSDSRLYGVSVDYKIIHSE